MEVRPPRLRSDMEQTTAYRLKSGHDYIEASFYFCGQYNEFGSIRLKSSLLYKFITDFMEVGMKVLSDTLAELGRLLVPKK